MTNQHLSGHDGTLRVFGAGSVDHLDPMCSGHQATARVIRLYSRQLFAYRAADDPHSWQAIAPVPDLALEIPSIYNAGLGASHRSYVVTLRRGVFWDTEPPREVTTHDVIRGLKRMCNPVLGPSVLPYFTSTIRGLAEFCAAYADAVTAQSPTAGDLAAFQDTHEISGVFALDDETMMFELRRPALDFVDIMALPCAAPAPVEYDAFVPGGADFAAHVRSIGPYRPVEHIVGERLRLEPNPAWRQETDPVRRQRLTAVEVGWASASAEQTRRALESGHADLPWQTSLAEAYEATPPEPAAGQAFAVDPYLVFNLRSPNAGGAMADVAVRRAIAYAIDKVAIGTHFDDLGAGTAIRVAGSIIPPGNDAHQDLRWYPTPEDRGDPARCRALLAEAGHAGGLVLTAIHPRTEAGTRIARSYAADLNAAGITLRLHALDEDGYHRLLRDPKRGRAGEWDLAAVSRHPDWLHRNGRVFLQPIAQTNPSHGTGNHGGYHNPEVDRLIEQALDAVTPAAANEAWQAAERLVLDDAAVVPILFQAPVVPRLRGPRLRDGADLPWLGHTVDLATLGLAPSIGTPEASGESGEPGRPEDLGISETAGER